MLKGKKYLGLFLAVILVGSILRIYHLGRSSLWFDEAKSVIYSEKVNLKTIWTGIVDRYYPSPLYELFIHYWGELGNSEVVLRLSSVLFSVISILAIYYLGGLLFDRKVGLLSAFILALSPLHVYYAQEARMYSLIILLAVMTVYFLKRFLQSGRVVFCAWYSILHVLNIYTHYMTILILFAEIVFFGLYWKRYRHLIVKWLVCHLIIFLFLIPWLIAILFKLKIVLEMGYSYWMPSYLPSMSLVNVLITLKNFSIGYNVPVWLCLSALLLFLLFFLRGIMNKKKREEISILLCCLLIPVLTTFAISKFKIIYIDRHLIPSSIFYYIIVASGISGLKRRYKASIIIIIVILTSFALRNYYRNYLPFSEFYHPGVHSKKDHRAAVSYVIKNFQKGDVIFHTCENTAHPFEYYINIKGRERSVGSNRILPKGYERIVLRASKDLNKLLPFEYDIHTHFIDRSGDIFIKDYERIWIVFSFWDFERAVQPGSDQMRVISWMDNHYQRVEKKSFSGIDVYLHINKHKITERNSQNSYLSADILWDK
ncbi:MAG: glycosyltransferase family 39 protein [Candidatus Omnitrophota bacterium]